MLSQKVYLIMHFLRVLLIMANAQGDITMLMRGQGKIVKTPGV